MVFKTNTKSGIPKIGFCAAFKQGYEILTFALKQKNKVNNHVLEDFKEDEEEKIKEIAENIVKLIPTLIEKKMDLFSSKVNQNLNGI